MQPKYLDTHLKANPALFNYVCIPLRLFLAALFLFKVIPQKAYPVVCAVALFMAAGFMYKQMISPNNWKCYPKAICIYVAIALLALFHSKVDAVSSVIGLLLIIDVLFGLQAKHTFSVL